MLCLRSLLRVGGKAKTIRMRLKAIDPRSRASTLKARVKRRAETVTLTIRDARRIRARRENICRPWMKAVSIGLKTAVKRVNEAT